MTGRLGRAIVAAFAAFFLAHASAYAGPADLDPGFGTGGLLIVPGTDRFDPEAAPLLRADGKVTLAGLLRNSSDRVFLARFGAEGATDTAFGSGGEVHTNVIAAPDRRAHTTQLADGRIVVAGGSPNSGRVTLERYTAAGQPDTAFGSSGKVSVLLPTTEYFKVTAAVAQPDGKVLVAGHTNYAGKNRSFVVLRFTSAGLDSSFGSGGIARVAFGTRNATAWDLAILSNGKILAAGSVGDADATNLAAVRLTPAGALDTAFASAGRLEHDTSGASRADHATGVLADATGGFTVTGPSTTTGMLARFTSTGAPDGAFGTGGVKVGGFTPAGTTFTPADVVGDASGRVVVVGTAREAATGTTRWLVARADLTGANPFDAAFGTAGVTQLSACLNHNGHGPTGAAVSAAGRIVVLGACNEDGRVAAVRLLGTEAFTAAPSLSVTAASEAAGHERIPLAKVEPASVLTALETLQAAPLRSIPLRSIPLRSIPLRSIDLLRPLRSIPLRSILLPLRSIPLRSIILLSDLPLRSITWHELLGVEGPLQSYTLDDAFRINPDAVGDLTLDRLDLTATPLRSITLAGMLLGITPLNSLPAPSADGWCGWLRGKKLDCENGVDLAKTSLLELEAAGVDMTGYLAEPVSLAPPTQLGSGDARAPIARLELRQVELSRTPYGPLPAASIGSLLKCGASCTGTVASQQAADPETFSTATLGELIALLPKPGGADITLGGLLAGIVAPAEIPFENARKELLLAAADLRSDDLQTYATTFAVDCAQAAGLTAIPGLPGDARLVPGSATVSVDGGAPRAVPDSLALGQSVCTGPGNVANAVLRFAVEPGSELGPQSAAITLRSAFGKASATRSTRVDDSRDPGDGPDNARALGADRLLTGHIASASDVDSFTFTPTEAGRVTITLSHLPADYDLAVYGPDDGPSATLLPPLRSIPLRSIPLRSIPVPDGSELPLDGSQSPDAANDLSLRAADLLLPLRSISINRERAAEAVSFLVRPADVGKRHMVEVMGYNGASSEKPYVLRRVDRPAPPAPPCVSRSGLAPGAPGAFPATVPADTETLILVNQQRLAARETVLAATQTRSRLDALAQATKGVVVPVESDALRETGSEYAAWDADPCDVAKANAVADAVLGVVDHVRTMGGGLPKLKSVVIAGTDEDIPMFRETDFATIANETDYADEAVLGGRDNATSAAQRQGYLLSDDRFGDVNPNARLSVPDVAIGRLVESTADIRAQVDSFLSSDGGYIDPKDAFVAGYDFLKDGAQGELDALRPVVPAGGATGRIDETWDAATAMAAINRPNAGFTAVNAHYNHFQGLPAAAFNGNGSADLMEASQANPAARSLAFTVGCHGGLNLAVSLSDTGGDTQRLGDWVQQYASRAAMYAGNTGFGYGDTDTVSWSERLMRDYAVNLASKKMTVGQALMYAKQANAASLGVTDDYWNKASMEAVFYGLPMWKVSATGTDTPSAVPAALPQPEQVRRTAEPIDMIRPAFVPKATDRGTYWVVDGQDPLAIQHRPIQPKTVIDVTPKDDAIVHGFLPEHFATTETAADPVVARPRIDLAAHEPEPPLAAGDTLWPAVNFDVSSQATPSGQRQSLVVIAGEYRRGTQRLFTEIGGKVLRSNSRDFQPLVVERVDGVVIGDGFSIAVEVDSDDVAGGNVLYRTSATGAWHRVNLALTGARRLGAGGLLPGGERIIEAKVHVYDEAGNVSASDNKVLGYTFDPLVNAPAFPKITFSPENTGYYADSPTIGIDPGPATGVTYEYSVDGGALTPYSGPFTLPEPDEGEHFVRVIGSDGSVAVARFAVDSVGPALVPSFSPGPNAEGWNNGDVVVSFDCADAVSGVKACPAPVTVTGEGRNLTATGTATDRAGHSTTLTVDGIDIDRTKPGVISKPDRAANANGWYGAPVEFSFACTDALSGVGFCSSPRGTGTASGTAVTVDGRGADKAGNETAHTSEPVKIDLGDPSVAIDAPFGGVLLGPLTGTASDNLSGVEKVVVTYASQLGGGTKKVDATLTPVAGKPLEYTWSAPSPGTGVWRAFATATDFAGRPKDSAAQLISVN